MCFSSDVMKIVSLLLTLVCLSISMSVCAAESAVPLEQRAIEMKRGVVELGREMHIFEREKLHPDPDRVSVFFSLDVGSFMQLESLKLKMDDEIILLKRFHHHETEGLENGAALRVHVGSYQKGRHKLVAFVQGRDVRNETIKKGHVYQFSKRTSPVFIEVKVSDVQRRLEPRIEIREW